MAKKPDTPLEKRFWAETKSSKPKSTATYIPLDQREDQSWRKKVQVIPPGQ